MAEMYKELSAGYQLRRGETETTGRRWFQRNDTSGTVAVAALPTVGTSLMVDRAAADVPGCIARFAREIYVDGHGGTPALEYTYSTSSSSASVGGGGISQDDDFQRFEIGGESVLIEPPSDWQWDGAGTKVKHAVRKDVLVGTFTITRTGLNAAEDLVFKGTMIAHARTINAAAFKGFNSGCVRFEGAEGGSYRDANGALRYGYDLVFAYRLLDNDLGGPTTDTWLYELYPGTATWDIVERASDGKRKYKKTDFSVLVP